MANDVIVRAIRSAEFHAELEPTRLLRQDGKRPDGATLDPWARGQYLIWDFTCPDTLAPSHLNQSQQRQGQQLAVKRSKYRELVESPEYIFVTLAIETLGAWGQDAQDFTKEPGNRLTSVSGDPRDGHCDAEGKRSRGIRNITLAGL